ncbi:MAG: magnesium transporter [Acidimicrobiales bacterium]
MAILSPIMARLRALLGPDTAGVRQSLVALVLSSVAMIAAGVILASATQTLEELPGLLLLVPAAIALRGNVFGALGSRLGTAINMGTFTLSRRLDTLVGQNIVGAIGLSLGLSVAAAFLAKVVAIVFSVSPTMGLADFVVVSVAGGILASLVVLVITLVLAAGSVRSGWNLDNVTAPLVTAAGDVATLPALIAASWLTRRGGLTVGLAIILVAMGAMATAAMLRTVLPELRRIAYESFPVLLMAIVLDLIAGITVEKRLDQFARHESLLILLPAYFGAAGSLGGILSSRLSTKFHLGVIDPRPVPQRAARADIRTILLLSLPVFALVATLAELAARLFDFSSPGLMNLITIAVLGGIVATVFVVSVSYFGTLAAVRLGFDPDTYGIPIVTSTIDFVGAFTLILAIVLVGI